MYNFEQRARVLLEFKAMTQPVELFVPWNVLFYLDMHAERRITPDGDIVYRNCDELKAAVVSVPRLSHQVAMTA
jgi:hypothetical protein